MPPPPRPVVYQARSANVGDTFTPPVTVVAIMDTVHWATLRPLGSRMRLTTEPTVPVIAAGPLVVLHFETAELHLTYGINILSLTTCCGRITGKLSNTPPA
jgi:hypothetical protein